ncbi:succinyl-CoA synthetase subunit beta [Jannaschia sp.]|nr:succinyl-CoA synthetase subunit beta [Jannaschia sp.]
MMPRTLLLYGALSVAGPAHANPLRAAALDAFARNCLSPHLTAQTAQAELAPHGRYDFYDLRPFSADAPSAPTTQVTPKTDRRCEIAFDGDDGQAAAETAAAALEGERIRSEAPMPLAPRIDEITTLRGARFLNPARIAVVETGTRPGPNGPETFLRVERLTPDATREALE